MYVCSPLIWNPGLTPSSKWPPLSRHSSYFPCYYDTSILMKTTWGGVSLVLQAVTAGKPRQLELEATAPVVSVQLRMPRELLLFCSVQDPSPENGAYFRSASSELSYPSQSVPHKSPCMLIPRWVTPDPVRLIISIHSKSNPPSLTPEEQRLPEGFPPGKTKESHPWFWASKKEQDYMESQMFLAVTLTTT